MTPRSPRLPHRLPIAWPTPCSHTNLPILSPPPVPHQARLHLFLPTWPAPGGYYPHTQLRPNSPSGAAAATAALRSFLYLSIIVCLTCGQLRSSLPFASGPFGLRPGSTSIHFSSLYISCMFHYFTF